MVNFLKDSFRSIRKNKIYSFLNIFGLAVGITCAALIFLWVEDERGYDTHNKKKNRLYQVLNNQTYEGKISTYTSSPGPLGPALVKELPGIRNSCRFSWQHYSLFTLGDKLIYERGYYADSSVFSMFTIPFIEGSPQTAFDRPEGVVISETMARKFFGKARNFVGQTLTLNNKENVVITGVIKDIPENSTIRFDWLGSFKSFSDKNPWLSQWSSDALLTFVELEKVTNADVINKSLYNFIQLKDTSASARAFLFSMNDWRLRNKFVDGNQAGGRIGYVKLFSVIAWIILLIACINYMNLSTGRSEKRAKEVSVRKVLGAPKQKLIFRFIGEALFITFIALVLAICLLSLFLPAFNLLVGKHLSLNPGATHHIYFLLTIWVTSGLIAGSYPALYLSSFNPIRVLKESKIKGSASVIVRKSLVTFQFAISIALIISTIIISQQVQHVKNRELGFEKTNLVQTGLRGDIRKNYEAIKQELLATGYVQNAALSSLNMLYMGNNTSGFRWEGKDPTIEILITCDYVTPEYLSTAGISIIKGRDFFPDKKSDSLNVIINETLAMMIGSNPLGKILYQHNAGANATAYTIVGVAKNFVFADMYAKPQPLIFFCSDGGYGYMYLRIKDEIDIKKAMSAITPVMKKSNPGYPFNYIFVDDEFNLQFKTETLIGRLSRVFALLAIIISCLGLFGLSAYTTERRVKEIGIRKVLGASIAEIFGLLSKEFLQLVGIAACIAFPFSWWIMKNWLQGYAYRININVWVFIIAGFIAVMIALITISFQSLKAAFSNPVKSLRNE